MAEELENINHQIIGNLENKVKTSFLGDIFFKVLCAAALCSGSIALFGEEIYSPKTNINYNVEVFQDTTKLDSIKTEIASPDIINTPIGVWEYNLKTESYEHSKK